MITKSSLQVVISIAALVSAAGCSTPSMNFWPFGASATSGGKSLENATEFRCAGGKVFHVRYLEGGNAAWVILPERQVRLDKVTADAGNRYSNGVAVLKIDDANSSLADGPLISYVDCKTGAENVKK